MAINPRDQRKQGWMKNSSRILDDRIEQKTEKAFTLVHVRRENDQKKAEI
jgi:hypothetical protein